MGAAENQQELIKNKERDRQTHAKIEVKSDSDKGCREKREGQRKGTRARHIDRDG
jgi:hypothetical protein